VPRVLEKDIAEMRLMGGAAALIVTPGGLNDQAVHAGDLRDV
jgi:hypothetical protein